jgi:hypothetical protein
VDRSGLIVGLVIRSKLGTRPLVLGSTGPKQRGNDESRMRPYRAAATIRVSGRARALLGMLSAQMADLSTFQQLQHHRQMVHVGGKLPNTPFASDQMLFCLE